MTKKTIITGIIGLSITLLGVIGKSLDLAGSNEAVLLGALVVVFGFLLSAVRNVNRQITVSGFKSSNWLGFAGASAVVMGIPMAIIKYHLISISCLSIGGILLIVYMFIISSRVRGLISE